MEMVVRTDFAVYNGCRVRLNRYQADNSLWVGLWSDTEGPIATLTTCLGNDSLLENESYLDTNNCPFAESLVDEYGLGELTGEYGQSGFCWYPVVAWDMGKLEEYKGGVL